MKVGEGIEYSRLGMEVRQAPQRVAVLDAGGQYIDLVQKACVRLGHPADILPLDTSADYISVNYGAVIMSGSPANAQDETAPRPDPNIHKSGLPFMGICQGLHEIVMANGGLIERGSVREDGQVATQVETSHPLFRNVKQKQTALFTHGNFITRLPNGFDVIGQHQLANGETVLSAIARGNCVGVQFHPEVFDESPEGYQVFKNFLQTIAGLEAQPNLLQERMTELVENKKAAIAQQVADRDVIAFVSGGVDSSVAAMLTAQAIPAEKIHAFYIDNGFMRDEDDMVIDLLRHIGIKVESIVATETFAASTIEVDGRTSAPLQSVTEAELKRKIIGKTFIDIRNQILGSLDLRQALLLQGTNAADRIESGNSKGDKNTATIKTHHNQVKEVKELEAQGLLLEPLDDLFKDEIRNLGQTLGLPNEVTSRQPFPGPGLAIRVLCNNGHNAITIPRSIHLEVNDHISRSLGVDTAAFRTSILPVRSVGVGGDERSYLSAIAIQGIQDWSQLEILAADLPGRFRSTVNRVVVALGENLITTSFATTTELKPEALSQLRKADRIVFEEMRGAGLLEKIKQCPVVLLPLSFGVAGKRSIVLRPVKTSTFMTAKAMVPGVDVPEEFIWRCASRILTEVNDISQVFLDLTNKPPGTTEWE